MGKVIFNSVSATLKVANRGAADSSKALSTGQRKMNTVDTMLTSSLTKDANLTRVIHTNLHHTQSTIDTAKSGLGDLERIVGEMKEIVLTASDAADHHMPGLYDQYKKKMNEYNKVLRSTTFDGQDLLGGKNFERDTRIGLEMNNLFNMQVDAVDNLKNVDKAKSLLKAAGNVADTGLAIDNMLESAGIDKASDLGLAMKNVIRGANQSHYDVKAGFTAVGAAAAGANTFNAVIPTLTGKDGAPLAHGAGIGAHIKTVLGNIVGAKHTKPQASTDKRIQEFLYDMKSLKQDATGATDLGAAAAVGGGRLATAAYKNAMLHLIADGDEALKNTVKAIAVSVTHTHNTNDMAGGVPSAQVAVAEQALEKVGFIKDSSKIDDFLKDNINSYRNDSDATLAASLEGKNEDLKTILEAGAGALETVNSAVLALTKFVANTQAGQAELDALEKDISFDMADKGARADLEKQLDALQASLNSKITKMNSYADSMESISDSMEKKIGVTEKAKDEISKADIVKTSHEFTEEIHKMLTAFGVLSANTNMVKQSIDQARQTLASAG